jgi:ribosome assembly protein YihI (activator of Der GTPase)
MLNIFKRIASAIANVANVVDSAVRGIFRESRKPEEPAAPSPSYSPPSPAPLVEEKVTRYRGKEAFYTRDDARTWADMVENHETTETFLNRLERIEARIVHYEPGDTYRTWSMTEQRWIDEVLDEDVWDVEYYSDEDDEDISGEVNNARR